MLCITKRSFPVLVITISPVCLPYLENFPKSNNVLSQLELATDTPQRIEITYHLVFCIPKREIYCIFTLNGKDRLFRKQNFFTVPFKNKFGNIFFLWIDTRGKKDKYYCINNSHRIEIMFSSNLS